jgi:hypothetical protein
MNSEALAKNNVLPFMELNFFFIWLYNPIQALAASMKLSVSL